MAFETRQLRQILELATRVARAVAGRTDGSRTGGGRTRDARAESARPGPGRAASGRAASAPGTGRTAGKSAPKAPARQRGAVPEAGLSVPYRGDYRGRVNVAYSPDPDGRPDPGEIIWTWVPYEEDHSRGKDRPVLLIGHAGDRLLGLMLTSKDHDGGRTGDDGDYVDIGSGPWDARGRSSEVRLDRIIQIDPRDMRREGAVLDESRFDAVARALRRQPGGQRR